MMWKDKCELRSCLFVFPWTLPEKELSTSCNARWYMGFLLAAAMCLPSCPSCLLPLLALISWLFLPSVLTVFIPQSLETSQVLSWTCVFYLQPLEFSRYWRVVGVLPFPMAPVGHAILYLMFSVSVNGSFHTLIFLRHLPVHWVDLDSFNALIETLCVMTVLYINSWMLGQNFISLRSQAINY